MTAGGSGSSVWTWSPFPGSTAMIAPSPASATKRSGVIALCGNFTERHRDQQYHKKPHDRSSSKKTKLKLFWLVSVSELVSGVI